MNYGSKMQNSKIESIKYFIEIESKSGCKLISTEYHYNEKKVDAIIFMDIFLY